MANITLQTLFGKYLQSIKSSQQDFRKELNKETVHFLQQDIDALKSQISLVNAKIEKEFDKKYGQALDVLQKEGMSNVTFNKISRNLKEKFLDHFTSLKEIGVDTGHVYANLTMASKQKAQTEIFEGFTGPVSEYSQVQLTPKNLDEISKTIALIATYTGALEELDRIQDRKSLIEFLKKAPTFKQYARTTKLNTLDDIKSAIESAYETKGKSKGLSELSDQIFRASIDSIKIDSTINFARKITASDTGVAVTFEIAAVNQFKGQLASNIKNAFALLLQNIIEKDEFSELVNKALTKALQNPLTREEFLQIFPKSSGSKTLEEAIQDIFVDNIKFGKSKPYKANSKSSPKNISNAISIASKAVRLKAPTVKKKPINIKTKKLNLVGLTNLFNSQLVQQVKQNMGAGNRRDILNLRSGRFAESVGVQRLTLGREGMLSVYYNYMKYPYATFSDGGRQEYPKTRDPKLLISKSIREIAAQAAVTRLRAVLV